MDYYPNIAINLGTFQASVDDDKVVKGVRYFNKDHNLLPNSRRNSEFYAEDKQFVDYVAFNDGADNINEVNPTNPVFNIGERPVDYQHGKMS